MRPFLLYTILPAITIAMLQAPGARAQENKEEINYRQVFGEDYTYAENIIELHGWWSDTLESHHLEPHFALAIIFPELIRYSSILDYIQVSALEILYVQYGKDYSDFSIGYFQMKPSFAEHIEADIIRYNIDTFYPELSRLEPDTTDDARHRTARIERLKDERYQLLYLEAFLRIMDHLNSQHIQHMSQKMKLGFYAAAYNTGYFKDLRVIGNEMKEENFYTGLGYIEEKYSYASISLFFYLKN